MPRVIAVDSGSHAVKVSLFQSAGRRSGIEAQHSMRVPQDGTGIPSLADCLTALDELLERHKGWASPANEIGLVWSSELAALRQIVLPFTESAKVEQAMQGVVEGVVPYDMEDMVLSWRNLSVEEDTRSLVTLVKHDDLEQWLKALQDRQFDPRKVRLDGEVLGHFAPNDRVTAVVDVGHTHTTVSVVSYGKVMMVRAIDVAGRAFTRAIQQALDCSWDEAEALKHGGTPHDEETADGSGGNLDALDPKARAAVDGQMGLLLAEIRSTLIAAEDQHELDVEHLLLTGGGARLDPLLNYLKHDLGVGVARVTDSDGKLVNAPFAAGYGLNLHQHGERGPDVTELRVGALAFRGGINVLRAVMTYGIAMLAFFLVASFVLFVVQFRDLSQQQARAEERIKETVAETFPELPAASIRDATTAKAIMSERTVAAEARSAVLSTDNPKPPTIDMLYELTKAFPPPDQTEVDVTDLTITKTTITFTAETDGYASASAVEQSLQATELFKDAAKTEERKDPRGEKVTFTIAIPLTDEEEAG